MARICADIIPFPAPQADPAAAEAGEGKYDERGRAYSSAQNLLREPASSGAATPRSRKEEAAADMAGSVGRVERVSFGKVGAVQHWGADEVGGISAAIELQKKLLASEERLRDTAPEARDAFDAEYDRGRVKKVSKKRSRSKAGGLSAAQHFQRQADYRTAHPEDRRASSAAKDRAIRKHKAAKRARNNRE